MMKCISCGAEIDDACVTCPICGAENAAPEPEAKEPPAVGDDCTADPICDAENAAVEPETKELPAAQIPESKPEAKRSHLSAGRIALVVTLCVALIAVMVALVVSGLKKQPESDEPTEPSTTPTESTPVDTEPTEEATVPPDGNPNDETCKGTYTVSDEEIIAAHDTVVAKLGSYDLTNGLLQVYYWNQYYELLDYYGNYLFYIGLDATQPFDTQMCSGVEGRTWQQYFLSNAITNWMRYQALSAKAEQSDFVLDAETVAYLNNLEANLNSTAQQNGFADANEMLQADMGVGCNLADYKAYLELYYKGYQYFNDELDKREVGDEEIEAYYTEHEDEMIEYGYGKDAGHTINVRHILISPEEDTEEAVEACRVKAEELLEQWRSGEATEESFAALATEHTDDPGSQGTGGLYEGVENGSMVAEFNDWCFDEARQPGDSGLVKTSYGYHLMYFVSAGEEIWYTQSKNALMSQIGSELIEDAIAEFGPSIDYSAIKLGYVKTASES